MKPSPQGPDTAQAPSETHAEARFHRRRTWRTLAMVLLPGVLSWWTLLTPAVAGPNRCVDASGRTTFSDTLCPSNTTPYGTPPAPVVAASPAAPRMPLKGAPSTVPTAAVAASAERPAGSASTVAPTSSPASSVPAKSAIPSSYTFRLTGGHYDTVGQVEACTYTGRAMRSSDCGSDTVNLADVSFTQLVGSVMLRCKSGSNCATRGYCQTNAPPIRVPSPFLTVASELHSTAENDQTVEQLRAITKHCSGER